MCTSSSPVNLLMDFVGACQGNHRLQHPHPCVPCIVPVKPSTIEHWKPWLVDSAECMASQWIVTSPGLYTCPKLHFSKDKAANLNQVTALCADWKKIPFSTSFSMFLQHEDIWSLIYLCFICACPKLPRQFWTLTQDKFWIFSLAHLACSTNSTATVEWAASMCNRPLMQGRHSMACEIKWRWTRARRHCAMPNLYHRGTNEATLCLVKPRPPQSTENLHLHCFQVLSLQNCLSQDLFRNVRGLS